MHHSAKHGGMVQMYSSRARRLHGEGKTQSTMFASWDLLSALATMPAVGTLSYVFCVGFPLV